MGEPLFRREEDADFSLPAIQLRFTQEAKNPEDLISKELIVNQSEQQLLKKRIELMKGFINDLPASDPQYNMLLLQIEMDQVELNELRARDLDLRSCL